MVTVEPSIISEKEIEGDPGFAGVMESFLTWDDAVAGKLDLMQT